MEQYHKGGLIVYSSRVEGHDEIKKRFKVYHLSSVEYLFFISRLEGLATTIILLTAVDSSSGCVRPTVNSGI